MLFLRPRGAKVVQSYKTGCYASDPERAMGLLSRVWTKLAQDSDDLGPVTVTGRP
jgi:hypothetical protein